MKLLIINIVFLISNQNYFSQNNINIKGSSSFINNKKSNVLLILDTLHVAISIDTSVWGIKQNNNPLSYEYNFSPKSNNTGFEVMLLAKYWDENLERSAIDSLLIIDDSLFIRNYKEVSNDIKITKKEYKKINGLSLWDVEMLGTINGESSTINIVGYYYEHIIGRIHILAFSTQEEINKYRKQINDLFNGIRKYD